MAKSIPYKDRPIMRIEGLLLHRGEKRIAGTKYQEYIVQKGNTKYSLVRKELLDGLKVDDRAVFDCIERQAITFKYVKVKLSDKELRERLGVKSITYDEPAKDPSVFKREAKKIDYIEIVNIEKGTSFNQFT
jgi:hypothetical protein